MGCRRASALALLVAAVACGPQPGADDEGSGGPARNGAEPGIAGPTADAAVPDAPAIEAGADATTTDASTADAPADAAPEAGEAAAPDECAPRTCATSHHVAVWLEAADGTCLPQAQHCVAGCVAIVGGAACREPPPECALGAAKVIGEPCSYLAQGLCFEDAAAACACTCAGKSCTFVKQKKPRLKLPSLKKPTPLYEVIDASVSDGGDVGDGGDVSDGGDVGDGGDAGDAGDDASATDAAPPTYNVLCNP